MDAKGGSSSFRPFALTVLAKESPRLLLGAVLCTWLHRECSTSSIPLLQCQLSYSCGIVQLLKSHPHKNPQALQCK